MGPSLPCGGPLSPPLWGAWILATASDAHACPVYRPQSQASAEPAWPSIPDPDLPLCMEHIPAHLSFSRSGSLIAPRTALDGTCLKLLFQGHLLCLLGCPPWPPASVGFPLAHGLGSHLGGQARQAATASSPALLLPGANY